MAHRVLVLVLVIAFAGYSVRATASEFAVAKIEACANFVSELTASQTRLKIGASFLRGEDQLGMGALQAHPYLITSEVEVVRAESYLSALLSDDELVRLALHIRSSGGATMTPKRSDNYLRRKFRQNFWLGPSMLGHPEVRSNSDALEVVSAWVKALEENTIQVRIFCQGLRDQLQ